MSEVGSLNIRITADDSQAQKGLADTRKGVQKTDKSITRSMKTWAKWGAAAALAAGAVAVAMTKAAMTTIDELAKTSRAIGGSIDALQALRMAADDTGLEGLEASLNRMNRRLGAAEFGAGAAAVTVKALNLDLEALGGMDVDQRLQSISKSIDDAGISSQQAARHLQNLGFEQKQAVEFFREGVNNVDAYREEIDALGLSLSAVDAAQVEQANDAMGVFGDVIQSVFMRAAIEVAPIIQGIADAFLDAAKEAGGMGEVVAQVMDSIVVVVGKASDSFRGWQLIIKGLEVAFHGLVMVVSNAMAAVVESLNSALKVAAEGVNFLIRGMNNIPKVNLSEIIVGESEMARSLRQSANDARIDFADSRFAMEDMASRPLPSDNLTEFVVESRRASREAAEAFVAGQNERNEAVVQANEQLFSWTQEENQKWLGELQERFMSEDELWQAKHETDLMRLQEAKAQELLTEQQYLDQLQNLEQEAADRRAAIAENERRQRVGIMSSMMQNLSTLMNTGSKKMFQIGKAAAIANALIQGKEAIVSSYAAGARIGGPYVGAAFAATAAVATAAQIGQIKSQSFGGGSSPTVFSGGVPAVNTTTGGGTGPVQPAQTTQINITGQGSTFTVDQVRELIGQINEQAGDGVNIDFSG